MPDSFVLDSCIVISLVRCIRPKAVNHFHSSLIDGFCLLSDHNRLVTYASMDTVVFITIVSHRHALIFYFAKDFRQRNVGAKPRFDRGSRRSIRQLPLMRRNSMQPPWQRQAANCATHG